MPLLQPSIPVDADGSALTLQADSTPPVIIQRDVSPTSQCDEGTLPSPTGEISKTLTGSSGGSCTITADRDENGHEAVMECTDFDNGDGAALNGKIGMTATGDDESATDQIASEDLTMTFSDGTSCDIVMNTSTTRQCNSISISGCHHAKLD